jgi:hypothetical protein
MGKYGVLQKTFSKNIRKPSIDDEDTHVFENSRENEWESTG